jgi:hypothetical protein
VKGIINKENEYDQELWLIWERNLKKYVIWSLLTTNRCQLKFVGQLESPQQVAELT